MEPNCIIPKEFELNAPGSGLLEIFSQCPQTRHVTDNFSSNVVCVCKGWIATLTQRESDSWVAIHRPFSWWYGHSGKAFSWNTKGSCEQTSRGYLGHVDSRGSCPWEFHPNPKLLYSKVFASEPCDDSQSLPAERFNLCGPPFYEDRALQMCTAMVGGLITLGVGFFTVRKIVQIWKKEKADAKTKEAEVKEMGRLALLSGLTLLSAYATYHLDNGNLLRLAARALSSI